MKNSNSLFKMFVGIFIGILATLFLTLNYFGYSFSKITLSIILGVIIGMFVADFKLTIKIFQRAFGNARNLIIQTIESISEINLDPRKVSNDVWLKRYLVLSLVIKYVAALLLFYLGPLFLSLSHNKDHLYLLFYFYSLPMFVILFASLINQYGIYIKLGKKSNWVWRKEDMPRNVLIGINGRGLTFGILFTLAKTKGILFIEWKSIKVFLLALISPIYWYLIGLKKIVVVGGYLIIVLSISLILSIIFVPLYTLREIWISKKMLVVVLSIVAGGIIGTITESYIYGLSTGFILASTSLVLGQFFSRANLFFYWKGLIANKNLWEDVISI